MRKKILINSLNEDSFSIERAERRKYNKELINSFYPLKSLDEIVSVQEGHAQFPYKGYNWDVFIHEKTGDNLLVQFNGSRPPKSGPAFKRWSWYPCYEGSVLNIDDPTYGIFPDLWLGWYYGKEQDDLCMFISEIIKFYAEKRGKKNIILYASSGGGIAAVRVSKYLDGCKTIVINPQLVPQKYDYSETFEKVTGCSLADFKLDKNYAVSMSTNSKSLCVINVASKEDIVQLQTICEHYSIEKVALGLNVVNDNFLLWLYNAPGGQPHNNQENLSLFSSIMFLIEKMETYNARGIVEVFGAMFLSISDFWQDYYDSVSSFERRIVMLNCEMSTEKMELFLTEKDKNLFAGDDVYFFYNIPILLRANHQYSFDIHIEEACDIPHFVVKDCKSGALVFDRPITDSHARFSLITNKDISGYKIRIYPSKPGECAGKKLSIKEINVYGKQL